MKKLFFICLSFLFIQNPCFAQSDPAQWQAFVNSDDNYLISDTFRFQSFESSRTDTWNYTASKQVSLINAKELNITGQGGNYSVRLPLHCIIIWEPYSLLHYQNSNICLSYASKDIMKEEQLKTSFFREGKSEDANIKDPSEDNNSMQSFYQTIIKNNPTEFQLWTAKPAKNTKEGFYCIDSVYAFGEIQKYSLFTGEGDWNDTLRWTHLPPARNRNALIQGKVTVKDTVSCHSVQLNNGRLHILSGATLQVDSLILHGEKLSFVSSGEIKADSAIIYQKTFPEKGRWYFISLPFDIYPEGIDSTFLLKDDRETASGNFFYMLGYDSEKRAAEGTGVSNWKVINAGRMEDRETPLFRRNTGYLIALDEGADHQTMRFSTHSAPTSFTFGGSVPIHASFGEKAEDSGWYLCGNPLPSPLSLKQIESDGAISSVWVYDGTKYQAYPIGGNYSLPPFSAFFVKAEKQTDLTVRVETVPSEESVLIHANNPLSGLKEEPVAVNIGESEKMIAYYSYPYLFTHGVNETGRLTITNTSGRIFSYQEVKADDGQPIYLPLRTGVYFLHFRNKAQSIIRKLYIRSYP